MRRTETPEIQMKVCRDDVQMGIEFVEGHAARNGFVRSPSICMFTQKYVSQIQWDLLLRNCIGSQPWLHLLN